MGVESVFWGVGESFRKKCYELTSFFLIFLSKKVNILKRRTYEEESGRKIDRESTSRFCRRNVSQTAFSAAQDLTRRQEVICGTGTEVRRK
jgi:hypothetical protein